MPIQPFPEHTIDWYGLKEELYKWYAYLEICKAISGFPQVGILTNKQLRTKLAPHGHYEVAHIPDL